MLPRDFFLIGRRRDKVYTIWHKNVDGEGENEKSENQNMWYKFFTTCRFVISWVILPLLTFALHLSMATLICQWKFFTLSKRFVHFRASWITGWWWWWWNAAIFIAEGNISWYNEYTAINWLLQGVDVGIIWLTILIPQWLENVRVQVTKFFSHYTPFTIHCCTLSHQAIPQFLQFCHLISQGENYTHFSLSAILRCNFILSSSPYIPDQGQLGKWQKNDISLVSDHNPNIYQCFISFCIANTSVTLIFWQKMHHITFTVLNVL